MSNNYKPKWKCSYCGSYDVMSMDEAWFDPNNDYEFIEAIVSSNAMDWCNACNGETTLDECEKNYELWKQQTD